jgi:hypothetical protein
MTTPTMKKIKTLALLVAGMSAMTLSGYAQTTNIIVNDNFADGSPTNSGPLQANWWSSSASSGNSVAAYPNKLRLVSGTSGRGLHGIFTNQVLAVGQTIRATYTFTTPATVNAFNGGVSNGNAGFKIALMTYTNTALNTNLTSSSGSPQPAYFDLPGYMTDFDVFPSGVETNSNIAMRTHINPNATGRFLGTTTEWYDIGSGDSNGYAIFPNTTYVGVYSINRTATDTVSIFGSLSTNGVVIVNFTVSNSNNETNTITTQFGMLGFWANSYMFGSTTSSGEGADNGITFSNIKVEVVTGSAAPPTLNITSSGSSVILSWLTAGSSGYNLKSATSVTAAPPWSIVSPSPVVVGDSNFVTNTVTGSQQYYRLEKP